MSSLIVSSIKHYNICILYIKVETRWGQMGVGHIDHWINWRKLDNRDPGTIMTQHVVTLNSMMQYDMASFMSWHETRAIIIGGASKVLNTSKGCHRRFFIIYTAFKAWFVCVLLGFFSEFPFYLYYEPLAWFMMHTQCNCRIQEMAI